jgi:acyl-CoA synthetase (AMP-forming)/AMP-acid ligase II/pyrroloquinoline quinone (PQQ) biosynthesis protein C
VNPFSKRLLESLSSANIDSGTRGGLEGLNLSTSILGLAERLRHTCPQDRPVAVALDHSLENCTADLALLIAGLPALPLPSFFTEQQRAHALAEAGASACLVADAQSPDGIGILPLSNRAQPLPLGTAKISFTSGSSGTPKGICLSAEHLLNVADAVVARVGRHHAGRHLALLPPAVLLENVAGFYATLLGGGSYVALPQAEVGLAHPFIPDFAMMADIVRQNRITSLILVPEYLSGLVTVMETSGLRLPDLTIVAVGGARVPTALLERARAVSLPVRQGYGLTECGSVVTLEDEAHARKNSAGRPLDHCRVTIAPDGEILIDGQTYLGTTSGGMRAPGPLATGDIGRLDDEGCLWIEGRKSNLIITSYGRNISPEWVESELVGEVAIAQAMVYGDGQAQLSALIVSGGSDADIATAIASANARLPAYAHVTSWRRVTPFSPMNNQLTANGRLRRDIITRKYCNGEVQMTFFDRLEAETLSARARFAQTPQLQAGLAGNISRSTYIAYLTQAYHHVRHTVPLLQETLARVLDRPDITAALQDYIEEESGHEHWILEDISEAGGDAAAAASCLPNPATQAMVDHAYKVVRDGNPIGFFGMVYVLEGTSVALATQGAANVAQKLGLPPQAFTYLTSHGALDQEHMKGLAALLNDLDDPADQKAVIDMANAMFDLFGGVFASIPLETDRAAA